MQVQPTPEPRRKKKREQGIDTRHARSCGSRNGGVCTCRPTYQAQVWSRRERRRISKTFPTLAAARGWRQDAQVALRKGTMRAPSPATLEQTAEAWLEGVKNGTITARSRDPYKPSAIRGYESALRRRILPDLGGFRLSDITRATVQDFADQLLADGLNPSTVRNTLMPLRAIFRRAMNRGELSVNPTTGVDLPAPKGRRERFAAPAEGAELLRATPERDRPLWAAAMYAGLRRGELQALRWEDVDLGAGKIHVRRSWDAKAGFIEPKSRAGLRTVPIPLVLHDYLDEHKLRSPWADGLVFGTSASTPFTPSNIRKRAEKAWAEVNEKRAKEQQPALEPITLHECRHTYASFSIAAGVNPKALSTYMGHSSITITLDRYGHLMPGNEGEASGLLDAYFARAAQKARTEAMR
jgi:integrase